MSIDTTTGQVVTEALTPDEEIVKEECETRIARGLRSFREVGDALIVIRDDRLYRSKYASFETYCEVEWGLTRRHADRLAAAAEVADILEVSEAGPIGLTSESQARELAALKDDPDAMREAWDEAVKASDGNPTAKQIKDVVTKRTETPPRGRETRTETVETEPAPAAPERDVRGQRAAEQADQLARNFCAYMPEMVDERTVKRLEAWCQRWRNQ